eukprot:jgi/Bigna1/75692/fgenesh1_pg.36_\
MQVLGPMAAFNVSGASVVLLFVWSLLYEPVRNSLHRLGESVGGVGGVGGLTNQWPAWECDGGRVAALGPDICFVPGAILGFTTFGLVVFLLWVSPLAVFSISSHFLAKHMDERKQIHVAAEVAQASDNGSSLSSGVLIVWRVAEVLWFAVPAAAYLSSPFYQQNTYRVILAISIAAAFPLSWHLSLVALPASASYIVPEFTGWSKSELITIHKLIGWSACRWGAIHALGELIYVSSENLRDFSLKNGGENLIFWAGLITCLLLIGHTSVAYFRRHDAIAAKFVSMHRALAGILLLSAAFHWWPFALFLCPAVAMAATSAALRSAPSIPLRWRSMILATSLVASICGVCVVWKGREMTLLRKNADTYSPYAFPPAAVGVAFVMARLAAAAAMVLARKEKGYLNVDMLRKEKNGDEETKSNVYHAYNT